MYLELYCAQRSTRVMNNKYRLARSFIELVVQRIRSYQERCVNTEVTPMKVMIVEDDDILRRAIRRALKEWTQEVIEAKTLVQARSLLGQAPELIILDVNLPDGSGVELAKEISEMHPMPIAIACSGQASAEQAFQLKEYGVRGYLPKPLSLADLKDKILTLIGTPPDLTPHVSALVGSTPIKEASNKVRKTMLLEALSTTSGNKTQAGELLNISRQAVQQMINDFDIDEEQFLEPGS